MHFSGNEVVSGPDWDSYYRVVEGDRPAPRLVEACTYVPTRDERFATDCGCGIGADAMYLLEQGFTVHAFDVNDTAVERLTKRAGNHPRLHVTQSSFETYDYPSSDLVRAGASLFFCKPRAFDDVWARMSDSLEPGGIFCGDFLGVEDSWRESAEFEVCCLSEEKLEGMLEDFEVLRWNERNEDGKTAVGTLKHWHIYSVTARKSA
jgi:trans-aconitate methyltransferase